MAARFGEIAISMGFATAKQVVDALEKQQELRKKGVNKPVGTILLESGILDKNQFERILARCRLIRHTNIRR